MLRVLWELRLSELLALAPVPPTDPYVQLSAYGSYLLWLWVLQLDSLRRILQVSQLSEDTVLGEKLVGCSFLDDFSRLKHEDAIGVTHR